MKKTERRLCDQLDDDELDFCNSVLGGTSTENVEDYKEIRSNFLTAWNLSRPKGLRFDQLDDMYLDEEIAEKVFDFLVNIRAINFQAVFEPIAKGSRRRRVLDENGEWIEPELLEGRTIEHKPSEKTYTSYNPFTLVPLSHASEFDFIIQVESRCLALLVLHSHLFESEVIGLLAGKYDSANKKLYIEKAVPCESTASTGIQCEMDPVSQVQAVSELETLGYQVSGWYHSHPTFDCSPSVRDIENQSAYQSLFRRMDGTEPFVGAIVSPYDIDKPHTPISFITIRDMKPFGCHQVTVTNEYTAEIEREFISLLEKFKDEKTVDLNSFFEDSIIFEKIVDNVSSHFTNFDEISFRAILQKYAD